MGISPMHANEPSAQGLAPSPSTYPSSFSLNGTPTSAKPRRSKQAHSLVLDTDTIADVMDVTPVSASSAKRKQVRKAPPKAGAGRGRGRGGKGGRSRDSIGSVTDKTPSAAGSLGFNVAASPSSTSEAFGGSGAAPEYLQSLPYQRPSSGLEPHLPDRYNEDQHSERPKQYNIIQNEYQSGGMQDRQNILGTRELDLLSQPNLEDQQDLNSRDQHADFHEPQVSTPPHDHMTESFLKALDEYGKEELATADPPVSAIQADFDETGFDFDVSGMAGVPLIKLGLIDDLVDDGQLWWR